MGNGSDSETLNLNKLLETIMNLENVDKMLKKSSRIAKTRNDITRIHVSANLMTSYVLTGLETNQDLDVLLRHCHYCLKFANETIDELNAIATEIITDFENVTID